MKKATCFLICLIFSLFIVRISSAQLLDPNGSAVQEMQSNAQKLNTASGFGEASVGSIISTIIQAALGLLGAIFLALMLVAGFQWMTASGNETQTKKAKDTIVTAVIGLIIVMAAYAITYFIFKYLPFSGSSSGNGGVSGTP